jgi:L-aminopeptidase/D-esterase-like protein
MRNLITDVPGVYFGQSDNHAIASGVSVVLFENPAIASISILGGAPGTRDTALLEPEMTVGHIDAIALSGGSAFGLDAAGGVMAGLAQKGRGFQVGSVRVPIVPQAIIFDLLNGGDKSFADGQTTSFHPYFDMGLRATKRAGKDMQLGSHGAGLGATLADLKGGLGSASARLSNGFTVGAVVVVNAVGQVTMGQSKHFWAAPYERDKEFGGHGLPASVTPAMLVPRYKSREPADEAIGQNTTIAVIATDAPLTKAQCKRLAHAAQDGLARAIRPVHTPMDGDIVFAASTAPPEETPLDPAALADLCSSAADVLARAIARGVYLAHALPFGDATTDYRSRFGP